MAFGSAVVGWLKVGSEVSLEAYVYLTNRRALNAPMPRTPQRPKRPEHPNAPRLNPKTAMSIRCNDGYVSYRHPNHSNYQ